MKQLIRNIRTIRESRKVLTWFKNQPETSRNKKQIETLELGIKAYIYSSKLKVK